MGQRCISKSNMTESDKALLKSMEAESKERRRANKENHRKEKEKRRKKEAKEEQLEQLCKNVDRILDVQAQQNDILMSLLCQLASGSRIEIPQSLVRNVYKQYTESAS